MTSQHTIQQQHLHIEFNGVESDAWLLQNRLSGWCQDDLLPTLEKVFNRFADSESWSIDRLDIDAEVLTLEHWEQDLTAMVAEAIEKKLREQLTRSPSVSTDNIRHKTSQQSLAETLVYFLNTGRLPWSITLTKNKNFEQTLLDAWQDGVVNVPTDLILGALRSTSARKRLVSQFSPLFMSLLLEKLAPEGKKMITATLPIQQNPDTAVKQFERQLWETLFTFIATGKTLSETAIITEAWQTLNLSNSQQHTLENWLIDTHPEIMHTLLASETARKRLVSQFSPSLMTRLLAQLSPESPKIIVAILALLQNSDAPSVAENAVIAETWHTLQKVTPVLDSLLGSEAIASKANSFTLIKAANLPLTAFNTPTKQTSGSVPELEPVKSPSTQPAFNATDIKEGIYIENAGLILLHPFLPQFFSALGIADEDQLIQPERALCLLHFLTTGLLIAPEYELTLAKILCNIPLEMPVESDMELSESEREEAEALLNAVIRHWEALRNTSIDGLRGEFLLRFGKLSMRDGDWLLQVETKTVDILLNQLPWGISMIKLPWMQRMLWVEWDY